MSARFIAGRHPDAREVHAMIGSRWSDILVSLGIPAKALGRRPGPCPACGGDDRFVFERPGQRPGSWYCRGCANRGGDGFDLLQRVFSWDFNTTLRNVMQCIGHDSFPKEPEMFHRAAAIEPARPSARARALLRTACDPSDVPDVKVYLKSRKLWPLPFDCSLRAHPDVEYWNDGVRVGRFPALIAPVVDASCALVTVHVTHLFEGAKVSAYPPRKLLGRLTGRHGCSVRLAAPDNVLGVAEGIETALAASRLTGVPTWAALSAGALAKWSPPVGVSRVVIFADRDQAGMKSAQRLHDRLTLPSELRVPQPPSRDWADELMRSSSYG